MRNIVFAALFALLPFAGYAQDTPNTGTSSYNFRNILLISAGVVVGIIVVDLLVGSTLTVPAANVMSPAVQEASAAGAVFGEQVAAATAARDAKARADVIYALLLGSGALLGGWLVNQQFFETGRLGHSSVR
jgi:hypothetical protein